MENPTLYRRHGVRGTQAAWECIGYVVGNVVIPPGPVTPGENVRPGMEDALLLAGAKSDMAMVGDALREWENVRYRRTMATATSRIADAPHGIAVALKRGSP